MDYEKKYNDAMARLELVVRTGMKLDPAYVFPELAESEDERIIKFLLDYAIEMIAGLESDISLSVYDGIKGHDPDAEGELAQWQKVRDWLEKQRIYKPTDEDRRILNNVSHILIGLNFKQIATDYNRAVGNLLSLRLTWKPSKEQMETLYEAAQDAAIDRESGNALYELYGQLKKL